MKSLRLIDRRVGFLLTAFAFLAAVVSPGLLVANASAAVLQSRSIKMSSASADADDVTYAITFTPSSAKKVLIVDFCTNSPLVGQACTAPTGFSVASASTADSGYTASEFDSSANSLELVGTSDWAATTPLTLTVDHINNPTAAGVLYARLVTYADSATATAQHTDTDLGTVGTYNDDGGVALSVVSSIGVSAAVLESMTFCVSGSAIDESCTGTLTAPTLKLGEDHGGVVALDSGHVSTGSVYTQISTNASGGAVVRMKSSAAGCGGLLRAGGGSACNIGPATSDIAINQALFGVKTSGATGTATSGASNPTGTLSATNGYNASTFLMNYDEDEETGVTGPYGDDLMNTGGAPINNQNMGLTFGASVTNNTPAGLYSADISLVAAGTF